MSPEHPKSRERFLVLCLLSGTSHQPFLSICCLQHQPGALTQQGHSKWSLSVLMQDALAGPGEMERYKNRQSPLSQRLAHSPGIDMTNCESREALCVIKEKEVVWKYKGKRSEGAGRGGARGNQCHQRGGTGAEAPAGVLRALESRPRVRSSSMLLPPGLIRMGR